MKLMDCPIHGKRPISEFLYGGEIRESPDPDTCTDGAWADYVFSRNSVPGIKREWWCHVPSTTWFVAERDTGAGDVLKTYLYGSPAS